MPEPDLPADQALEATHRTLMQELLEGSPSGVFLLDRDVRIVWVNEAMARMLGSSREELIGLDKREWIRTRVPPLIEDGAAVAERLLAQYRDPDPGAPIACHLLATDGREERWIEHHSRAISVGPLRGGRVEFCTDVTDRRRAEEAVERLAARSEEQGIILENMHGFTYRHDTAGVFQYMSPSVQRITGYPVDDWMHHYTTYLTENPVNELVVEKTEETLRTGKTNEPYLVEIYHRDGSRVWLEVAERAYFEDGRVAGIVGVAIDVTERERAALERRSLETQLRYAQKLESLGILAGGIAHDFNNLLMAVHGNASLARDELPEDSKAREAIEEVLLAAQRAADLCRQMLAYSGRGTITLRAIDLSAAVAEIIGMIEISISKRVKLGFELDPELPPVHGDPTQIQQVILNLITNASEAVGDTPGEIHIRTGAGEFSVAELKAGLAGPDPTPGPYVWLEVEDTGSGMDAATQERIFDPFYSTKFTGRGLGLSTVLGIVRGHDGAIRIDSRRGKGTRFRVLFPAGSGQVEPPAETPSTSEHRTGAVLLVDDEPAVRTVGRRMLEKLGYEVLVAADARRGLELFGEHRAEIVCVVLDVTMPDMSGDECLRELRRLEPAIPVILASGYDESEATRRLDRSTPYGFLCKPYTRDALAAKLNEVIGAAGAR